MKTFTNLLLAMACVIMLFACSKINDDPVATDSQSTQKSVNAKGTGTDVYQFYVDWPSTIPVVCGGEIVDYLVAQNFYVMTIDHYKNGNFVWENAKANHIVYTSQNDGESFTSTGSYQKVSADESFFSFFCNFQGSNGTHYIAHIISDLNGDIIEAKSICR